MTTQEIKKAIAFETKIPEDQAKVEAKEQVKDFGQVKPNPCPENKEYKEKLLDKKVIVEDSTSGLSENNATLQSVNDTVKTQVYDGAAQDMGDGTPLVGDTKQDPLAEAMVDGYRELYKAGKIRNRPPSYEESSKINFSEHDIEDIATVIDSKTINTEKVRFDSGYKYTVENLKSLTSQQKLTLQGVKELKLLELGETDKLGFKVYQDAGNYSGYDSFFPNSGITSSNGPPNIENVKIRYNIV